MKNRAVLPILIILILSLLLCGCDSLRDVIAFPKISNSSELMSGAPAEVDEGQLKDLAIAVIKENK